MQHEHHPDVAGGARTYLLAQAYARQHQQPRHDASHAGPAFTIALSREAGIDAGAVAQIVGQRLGWRVWDHELLAAVAARLHAPTSQLETLDETHVSWLQESLESFLAMHMVSQIAYVHHLAKLVQELGERGDCIIVGRGASHLLPLETTLRVRLVAPLSARVVMMSRLQGATKPERAQRQVEKIDRQRTLFVQEHFHKNPADPTNYDLVLNTARLAPDDCAEMIIEALHAEQASRAHSFRDVQFVSTHA
jgi:cytidylate kinase